MWSLVAGGLDLSGAFVRADEDHQLRDSAAPSITCVTRSPDGLSIATAATDGTIKLWSLATGELLATFRGHTAEVTCVAFASSGQLLASGSSDDDVRLWSLGPEPPLGSLGRLTRPHPSAGLGVASVSFAPNGQTVVAVGRGRNASVSYWSVKTGDFLEGAQTAHSDAGATSAIRRMHSRQSSLRQNSLGLSRPGESARPFSVLPCTCSPHDRCVRVVLKLPGDGGTPPEVVTSIVLVHGSPIHATCVLAPSVDAEGRPGPPTARLLVVLREGPVLRFRALSTGCQKPEKDRAS